MSGTYWNHSNIFCFCRLHYYQNFLWWRVNIDSLLYGKKTMSFWIWLFKSCLDYFHWKLFMIPLFCCTVVPLSSEQLELVCLPCLGEWACWQDSRPGHCFLASFDKCVAMTAQCIEYDLFQNGYGTTRLIIFTSRKDWHVGHEVRLSQSPLS